MMETLSTNNGQMKRSAQLFLGGAECLLSTNSRELLNVLNRWRALETDPHAARFSMSVSVEDRASEVMGRAHFRGLHHVVIATFGLSDIFLFDLLRRNVVATISKTLARDARFWHAVLLPITVGVMGASVGVLPLHSACVSLNDEGLLIAGESGSGKSTLSVALAQKSFGFVADDWTYVSCAAGVLTAYGMSVPVKLLPDAVHHFRELEGQPLSHALNGELAYEVDPQTFGLTGTSACRPRWIVFPEQCRTRCSELLPISPAETRSYIEENVEVLPEQLAVAARLRASLIDRLSLLPCWKFCYHGTPQFAAQELWRLFVKAEVAA